MSALAKVFVVLNLLLTLLFFGTSATLFLTRRNLNELNVQEREKFREKLDELRDQVEKQKATLVLAHEAVQKVRTSEGQLARDIKVTAEQVTAQTARADKAESERAGAIAMATETTKQLQVKEQRMTQLESQLTEAEEKRKEALDAARQANEERARMKRDLEQVNGELMELKKEHVALNQTYDELQLRFDALAAKVPGDVVPEKPPVPLDAVVEAFDPRLKAVVLSVGRDQKVEVGDTFTVYRGDNFVGKVKVTRLYRDLSGAKVLFTKDGESIRVGDRATTRLQTLSS